MMTTITAAARIEKIQVLPLASEKAAPGFRTNVQLQDVAEHRDDLALDRGSR